MDKDVKKSNRTNNTRLLGISTFALLAFGIAAQILSEMMGYTPMLGDYFLYLLPTVLVGFWVYFAVVCFRHRGKICKTLLILLLVAVLVWSVFMCGGFLYVQFDEYFQHTTYGNGRYFGYADLKEENQYILSKCHLFGQGEEYYVYPDELAESDLYFDYLSEEEQQAKMERERVRLFSHFRWDMILTILSYAYGFWITLLFTAIAIAWIIGAVGSFRRLNLWWEKILYGFSALVITEQIILPLLGGYGVVACLTPHPFSMDWEVSISVLTPQLGVMFALLKTSKPKVTGEIATYEGDVVAEQCE